MSDTQHKRLDFGHLVDKVFWAVLTSASLYVAHEIGEMGHSIEKLNVSMAVVLYQLTENKEHFERLEQRVERIEAKRSQLSGNK